MKTIEISFSLFIQRYCYIDKSGWNKLQDRFYNVK